MRRTFSLLFIAATLALGIGSSEASLIVAWDVNGIDVDAAFPTAPHSFAATSADANATGALTLGSGTTPSTSVDQYGFKVPGASAQTTLAGAISNNHYVEISVNIAAGYCLNLNNISFNGDTSGTGADDVAFMTSIDGFVAGNEIASLSGRQAVSTGSLDTDSSGFGAPISLSGAQYQNLAGTVSFRLYGYNTSSGAGVTFFRNLGGNDIVLDGEIFLHAIPEPTAFLMFGTAIAGLGFRRRRS